jgi:hypothetical protein
MKAKSKKCLWKVSWGLSYCEGWGIGDEKVSIQGLLIK